MDEPLDKLDAEHIDAVLRSPGWALIEGRMKEEAHRKVRSLIDSGSEVELTRGFIRGLETAIKIPKIIAEETRKK
jgi:hypothetical protein